MLDSLFQIVIYPIYMALESAFCTLYTTLNFNIGLTILLISYIVFIFCLPLYLNAARLQHEEESIQAKMAKRVNSIKKNFSGDEKHLLLQTYYRQNNYHPVMALRLSFSLLLQVPFFFAAYLFFSHLQIFDDSALLHVASLAEPDRMIKLGNFTINLLPIVMTLVNITAAYVYTEDKSLKKNAQLYIMSLVFLVLLYNSPSGLVLYWTFNNLFSLIKNLGLRGLGEKAFVKCVFASALVVYYLLAKRYYLSMDIIVYILTLIIAAPYLKAILGKYLKDFNPTGLYFLTVSALWLLVGVLIPSNVVATSPVEFTFITKNITPFSVMAAPATQAFGLFLFWGGCFFVLSSSKIRKAMTFVSGLLLVFWMLNAFLIPLPDANLLTSLKFDVENVKFAQPASNLYWYLMFVGLASISILFIWARKFLKSLIIIVISALVFTIGANYVKVYREYKAYKASFAVEQCDRHNAFNFSVNDKNVLIIFLDRGLSSYLPLILTEKPELKDELAGFVYYPNTVSMAGYTFLGYQAITGGYEYIPMNMAKDTERTVIEKYKEGLAMLPALFAKEGWNTTVADAPGDDWSYEWLKTDEIYTARGVDYKKARGDLGSEYSSKNDLNITNTKLTTRNFLYYSFMTVSRPDLRSYIYNRGQYLNANLIEFHSTLFLENYAELFYLPQLTGFTQGKNSFILINNDFPHEPGNLYGPDYSMDESLGRPDDIHGFGCEEHSLQHYHVNAAAMILIGKYMDFLKENGVYDNTRIIIVSDHGRDVVNPRFGTFANKYVTPYNPLLLVKDFNSKGEFTTSDDFMTNADVPYLAAKDVIEDIRNPFTGKKITMDEKKKGMYIKTGHIWQPGAYEGKVIPFEEEDTLHFVKDNIFDKNNWKIDIPYKNFMIK